MRFTTAALTILANSAAVLAVPVAWNSTATPTSTSTPTPTPSAAPGLSLTAQLFLADTAADRYNLLPNNSNFVFDFNQPQVGAGEGGELVAANRKTFPALVGTGSGMAVGRVKPCGMNTPHVHPRATELQIVTVGRLVTATVPENGVNTGASRRVIENTITPYQMTPFPMGSIHTQFNPDCTDAVFVASFNSEDFGTGQAADELLAMSDDIVGAALGQSIDGADIDKVRHMIPVNIALGVEQCLQQCGIAKRSI